MPSYVEDQFIKASKEVGLKVEPRADGLWRVEHVLADLRSDRLQSVRHLGRPESAYRKITFHKDLLEQDQHVDAVLLGPGHPLYSAVDEKLNERLGSLAGATTYFIDAAAESPYLLHFFEISIRGQNTKGISQALYGELVAVQEETLADAPERFSVIPADVLLNLPIHPFPPATVHPFDAGRAADFLKATYHQERREACQKEKSFKARIRAEQDRVMALRAREATAPEIALARQRAENDLADLQRTERERLDGLNRLEVARQGPLRHLATGIVLPATAEGVPAPTELLDDVDPFTKRLCELAAEEVVITHETGRGWETEKVGHLKIGFDIRSLGPADPQTGYRDQVNGVRRIEVKGRKKG